MVSLTIATIVLNLNQEMTDFNYKKYSLENLENWLHDAMSAGDATPQEIYNAIVNVVKDNYYTYKHQTSQAYELLALLNGDGKGHIKEYDDCVDKILSCDKDDPSPECRGAWNDFWEDSMTSWRHSDLEYNIREAEYYNKESPLLIDGFSVNGQSHSEYWYDYDRNDPNRKNPFSSVESQSYIGWQDVSEEKFSEEFSFINNKVVKWQLPVEVDGLSGECYINLPDDLLEAANLKEGDQVEWIDNKNGSFTIKRVEK
jgi:hypothetical protein